VDGDGDVRRGRGRIALGTVSPQFPRNAGLAHARAAGGFRRLCDLEKGVVHGHVAVAVKVNDHVKVDDHVNVNDLRRRFGIAVAGIGHRTELCCAPRSVRYRKRRLR
jgi:hypothetical protein